MLFVFTFSLACYSCLVSFLVGFVLISCFYCSEEMMDELEILEASLSFVSSPLVGSVPFSIKFVTTRCVAGCFLCL